MSSLSPLNGPLGFRKAKHLLRRTSFKYNKEVLDRFAKYSVNQALEFLLLDTSNTIEEPYDPLPQSNPDGHWMQSGKLPSEIEGQGRKRAHVTAAWWYNAIQQTNLKHKLTFFLHTCFTVGKDSGSGFSSHFYDHLRLLEFYSFGNIKTLAKKITLDNSMLDYLDNRSNNANNPNENYAREFLELFTILKGPQKGIDDYTNYTEHDVQQAAKVFSGFKDRFKRDILDPDTNIPMGYANLGKHDTNDKIFSSAFNNTTIKGGDIESRMFQELDDFVEMVFEQEATAVSYCRKIYRFFVKSEWDEEVEQNIILPLSEVLIQNNYEILPVIETLFCSKHFYDNDDSNTENEIIGSIVKSPLQLLCDIFTVFNVQFPNPIEEPLKFYRDFFLWFVHHSYLSSAGMSFFNPDSVAGYPAHYQEPDFDRHWFASTTIISRYKLIESIVYGKNTITWGSIPVSLDAIQFVEKNISNPEDPINLVKQFSDILYAETIDESRIDYFVSQLVDGYNNYYWTTEWMLYIQSNKTVTIKARLDGLIISMINAPEFQLM